MTGFELKTSGIGSDCSTNWATTTALSELVHLLLLKSAFFYLKISFSKNDKIDVNIWHFKTVVDRVFP